MEAVDDPVPVWLLTPDNCADGDDADDSAGGNEQAGDHRSDSDFSNVVPSLSSRNAGLDRCGEWDSVSSLDWSKRSTDLTNIVVSVFAFRVSLRDHYLLPALADRSMKRDRSRTIGGSMVVAEGTNVVRVSRRIPALILLDMESFIATVEFD